MTGMIKKIRSWCVHCFTASSAVLGLWALYFITQQQIRLALILMLLTMVIDSIDGPIARAFHVSEEVPGYDGALLDNIVDFFTWVMVPCFLLLLQPLFSPWVTVWVTAAIVLASCYQFCCTDAKLSGQFFKRYPSVWSATVMSLYLLPWPANAKLMLLVFYIILSFIPIYVPKATARITLFSRQITNLVFNAINFLLQALGVFFIVLGLCFYPAVSGGVAWGLSLLFLFNLILWGVATATFLCRQKALVR